MSQSEAGNAYALENHDREPCHRSVPLLTGGCYGCVNAGRGNCPALIRVPLLCKHHHAPWGPEPGKVLPGIKCRRLRHKVR